MFEEVLRSLEIICGKSAEVVGPFICVFGDVGVENPDVGTGGEVSAVAGEEGDEDCGVGGDLAEFVPEVAVEVGGEGVEFVRDVEGYDCDWAVDGDEDGVLGGGVGGGHGGCLSGFGFVVV